MKSKVPVLWAGWLPPLLVLLLVLAVWQAAVAWWQLPALLLPGPDRVFNAAVDNWSSLWAATLRTATAAAAGFLLSLLLGTLMAMVFSQSVLIRRSLFPYAIFLQTVPIVAIAPVIVIWMGEGFWSVVLIATIISLFPVITNGTAGMLSVPEGLQELFQLNGATRWQSLFKLQLPNALPQLVTGAKIASGSAVLGAIVGEIFAGVGIEHPGLGYLIFVAKDRFNMAFLFAAIVASTGLGIAMFSLISLLGDRCLLSWRERAMHE